MNPYTGIAIAVLLATNAATGWLLKNEYEAHAVTKFDLRAKENTIVAMELAAKLDNQEAIRSYERADKACLQNRKNAVAALALPIQEEPKYEADGTPNPVCPVISVRAIQDAGSGAYMPSEPDGQDTGGTQGPQ
jgi:hypothetical protein